MAALGAVAMMCFTLLATHVAGHLLEGRTAARASEAAGFQSALGEAIGGMLTLRPNPNPYPNPDPTS